MMQPVRTRVTWCRWDARRLRNVISHPWWWLVMDAEGYERAFDTRAEALAWIAENTP